MKTKEFCEKVEKLGFRTMHVNAYIYIENRMVDTCAMVNEYNCYEVNTDTGDFYDLKKETKEELFNLLVEYSSTPIEERKEEKKYYLKHRFVQNATGSFYMNYKTEDKKYVLSDSLETDDYKTKFTKKEIEEIKQKFNTSLDDFEIIEVE